MAMRTGVKPGDKLYVTGTIGDAALGLKIRQGRGPGIPHADREFLVGRYLEPRPRTALAPAMAAHAHGGMDVSDGFVGDLTKMLAVSGVSARVLVYRVPMSSAARAAIAVDPALYTVALTGGDDYEILASVPPEAAPAFVADASAAGVPVVCIGEACEGAEGPRFVAPDGAAMTFAHGSYSHF
jgi:thiamine-monophosphate kinase